MTENDIPLDDEKTWDMISDGNTLGVFQMASDVAKPVLRKVKPHNMEELSAVNAFIRPGASGLEEYLEGKENKDRIRKLDPRIDRHLAATYGAIVYQEQIMFLISELLGISFGEADLYRRALEKPNKPKNKIVVDEFNKNIIEIGTSKGFKKEVCELLRDLIILNCGYGFNKCLSGKEKIYCDSNQHDSLTIEEMYKIKNDKNYAIETGKLNLHEKYKKSYGTALSMYDDGKLRNNNIIDIYYSGVKDVYLVTTEDDKTVKCTMNHNFPTPNGKKMLAELSIGDELYVIDSYKMQEYEKCILTKTSKIKSIKFVETENVYDIEMEAPNHNLLMENGVIVSNSHSIAYSIITYWTAWFKVNYPLIFYTEMFNGNLPALSSFMAEAKKNGITIKPPNVSFSKYESVIEDLDNKVIRIGLNAIKGIGPAAVDSIVSNQPYDSINDFIDRNNLRAVNKKAIEAIIKVDAFNGLGIDVENEDILSEYNDMIKNNKIYLNRTQMFKWYEFVNELNHIKTISKYAIPVSIIKGKYIDKYSDGMIIEKDDTVIIPEDKLYLFDISTKDIECYKTRKKPKGFLKEATTSTGKKIPIYRKAFINNCQDICSFKEDYLEVYLQEVMDLGYSFLSHPMEKDADKLTSINDVADGNSFITAGIIYNIEERTSKKGSKYYWVIIQTPREKVRVTFWFKQFVEYRDILQKYELIVVKGEKGYGGMNCDLIKKYKH